MKLDEGYQPMEPSKIALDLSPDLFRNLRILVVAGGKSSQTDEAAMMAAAHLLQIMNEAAIAASQKPAPEPSKAAA